MESTFVVPKSLEETGSTDKERILGQKLRKIKLENKTLKMKAEKLEVEKDVIGQNITELEERHGQLISEYMSLSETRGPMALCAPGMVSCVLPILP